MSKNTVKRLINESIEPHYRREFYKTKIDMYKEQIRIWFLSPEYDFIGTRIFRELKGMGYTGSIGPVYRFLNTLKEKKREISKKATVRIETPLGDQAQFDWSPYKMVINNEIREVYCFTMILAASRMKSIVFSLTVDADAIYEAIQELFSDLKGVAKELLIDNPKALVLENNPDREPVFNLDALRLATHLCMDLNPCNPYRAKTKGKIEKPYQYIEEQFVKGNTFKSMADLNIAGKKFMSEWCKKVHGTTNRIPEEFHKEELPYLLPLPEKKFMKSQLLKRKVSLDSYISIDAKKYSVPVKYVDKYVQYRIVYGYKVEIYDMNMNFIAHHEVKSRNEDTARIDEHFAPIENKTPKSIPEIKRQFISSFESGEEYLNTASKMLGQVSYHAKQILKLKELYTTESLDKILEYCMGNSIFDIDGIKTVLKEKYVDIVLKDKVGNTNTSLTGGNSLARDLSYYEGGGQD